MVALVPNLNLKRPTTYILEGHRVVPEPDIMKFAIWIGILHKMNGHVVQQTTIQFCGFNIVFISTVFLGIDHNYNLEGPPLVFETMIFGGIKDGQQFRFSTWEDAESFHHELVKVMGSSYTALILSLFCNLGRNISGATYPIRVKFRPLLARLKGWCIGIKRWALGPGRSR